MACLEPDSNLAESCFRSSRHVAGQGNNTPYDPFHYDVPTIFNVLEGLAYTPLGELVTWGVYNDTILPSLTRLQLPRLWDPALDGHFHFFETFKQHAHNGLFLPTASSNRASLSILTTSIRRTMSVSANNSFTTSMKLLAQV